MLINYIFYLLCYCVVINIHEFQNYPKYKNIDYEFI